MAAFRHLSSLLSPPLFRSPPSDKGLETDNGGGGAGPTSLWLSRCKEMDFAFAARYSSHGFTAVFCVWLNVLGALGGTTSTTPLRWLVNGGRRGIVRRRMERTEWR